MSKINLELLESLCAVSGAPGSEQRIRKFVIDEVGPLVDAIQVDALGNVIAIKKGAKDKKIAITAHMDEIAFIVTHISKDGFVRFHPLGGFDPKTLTAQRVIIHGEEDVMGVMGCKPIHVMTPEERKKSPKLKDYFIDTGYDAEALKKLIKVGDTITRYSPMITMGDCINAKSLDNRISVFTLIEALSALKDKTLPYHVYACFTVQEEVGLRGAKTVASGINPAFGINLDVTMANDMPDAQEHEYVSSLGDGTAIKVLDGSTICDYRMVNFLKQTAQQAEIPYQLEILPAGGTDTAALQRDSNGGSICGGISIPCRYLHQHIEMVNKKDVHNSIKLLCQALQDIDQYDWSFR